MNILSTSIRDALWRVACKVYTKNSLILSISGLICRIFSKLYFMFLSANSVEKPINYQRNVAFRRR